MVEHVYRRTDRCDALDRTYVATPDEVIRDEVESFGGEAIMTGPHDRAIDRVAEAASGVDAEVVVVVQGDEPLVHPEMITAAVEELTNDPDCRLTTTVREIEDEAVFADPNFPKVVLDGHRDVLYFSREPVPSRYDRSFDELTAYKHLAVVPFRREALAAFAALPQTAAEQAESIDLIRALEHGWNVRAVEVERDVYQVDTAEDHEVAKELLLDDELFSEYGRAEPPS